jgi:tetratricopeptide (TPR) repeat protein
MSSQESQEPEESVQSLVERGRNLRAWGSPAAALPLLLRAVRRVPDDPEIREEVRITRAALHELFRAVDDCERRAALAPGIAAIWDELAGLLIELDRDKDALAALDRGLAVDPDDVLLLFRKGNLLNTMSRFEEALVVFARLCTLEPDLSLPWTMTGMVLCNLHRYLEALPHLEAAITRDPGDIGAWTMKGVALSALGRDEEARGAGEREREARLASGVPEWMSWD